MRRAPFAEGRVDEVVAFALSHGSPFDGAILRALLLRLTSDAQGVLLLEDEHALRLVAVVVDRPDNGADAATLEIAGVAQAIGADAFSSLVLEPAIRFAAAGARRALHAPLYPAWTRIDGAVDALRVAGFAPCYELFQMRRPADARVVEASPPLEPGWRWETLELGRANEAHAALCEAFSGAMATGIVPLEEFRHMVGSKVVTWRILLDHETIAGLVRAAAGASCGEIQILARRPRYHGRGLGPRLMAEGLRALEAGGPGPVELEVEAANEGALSLYRRFGFEVVSRTPVLALELGLRRTRSDATS